MSTLYGLVIPSPNVIVNSVLPHTSTLRTYICQSLISVGAFTVKLLVAVIVEFKSRVIVVQVLSTKLKSGYSIASSLTASNSIVVSVD
ncbi:hypothetical protein IKN40_05450 [bacterium]|nr:hypothetical protein [bacterium]